MLRDIFTPKYMLVWLLLSLTGCHSPAPLEPLTAPTVLGFIDDDQGLRMTLTTSYALNGGGDLVYTLAEPLGEGEEIRLRIDGVRPCFSGQTPARGCPAADMPAVAEVPLDSLAHGEYSLVVASAWAEASGSQSDTFDLNINEFDVLLRPHADGEVVVPDARAMFVANHLTRGEGLFHWRRLQPDTVWVAIVYRGIVGGRHPDARDHADYWSQIAVIDEELRQRADTEELGMIEAWYAHPNFLSQWDRYPLPTQYESVASDALPAYIAYYRHTGDWDRFVAHVQDVIYTDKVRVTLYDFYGRVVTVGRASSTSPTDSPLAPPQ